jgi:DNA-binding NarL/FixJ family response regulator
LTERRIDVLRALYAHDGLKAAAAELGIAVSTLKTHIERICELTGTAGRQDAIFWGCRRGLVGPGARTP